MRQKAQLLLDEAASWSLLWYLYGKGNELLPNTFLLEAIFAHTLTNVTEDVCIPKLL